MTEPGGSSQSRLSREFVRKALDLLDEQACEGTADFRNGERFNYRSTSARCQTPAGSTGWKQCEIVTRNISRTGVSFIVGQFLYPGSEARVTLTTLHKTAQELSGKIIRCRYLPGTGSLYEVGLQFSRQIDLTLFVRGAINTHILLIDYDEDFEAIFTQLLQLPSVKITHANSGMEALELTKQQSYDMVFVELLNPTMDGFATYRALRKQGFMQPIIACTADDDEKTRTLALEEGFDDFILKPLDRQSLESTIAMMRDEPIVSSLMDEPDMVPLIDEFVSKLSDKIRALEKAFREGDLAVVSRITRGLKANAGTLGFEVITEAARELERYLNQPEAPDELRKELNRLCRMCMAARPATAQVS